MEIPVALIWFSKGVPSFIALLLDMSIKSLERVLYYEEYIVLDPGSTGLNDLDVISERECARLREEYGNDFRVGMGAEAVKEILMNLDLEVLDPDGKVITGSYSEDNTYEIVHFNPTKAGQYRLVVRKTRCNADPKFLGWAWMQIPHQVFSPLIFHP